MCSIESNSEIIFLGAVLFWNFDSIELESLREWLEENRLSLHLGKTQSILFGSKKRLRTSNKLHVVCNGGDIEPDVEVTTFTTF